MRGIALNKKHAPYLMFDRQVRRCKMQQLADHIASADVLVPLMSRLDKQLLQLATKAKLIIQYGVGLEAVDIPAVIYPLFLLVLSYFPRGLTKLFAFWEKHIFATFYLFFCGMKSLWSK